MVLSFCFVYLPTKESVNGFAPSNVNPPWVEYWLKTKEFSTYEKSCKAFALFARKIYSNSLIDFPLDFSLADTIPRCKKNKRRVIKWENLMLMS